MTPFVCFLEFMMTFFAFLTENSCIEESLLTAGKAAASLPAIIS